MLNMPEFINSVNNLGTWNTLKTIADERPEVVFREGVRRCLQAGIKHEKLFEIIGLEIAKQIHEM